MAERANPPGEVDWDAARRAASLGIDALGKRGRRAVR